MDWWKEKKTQGPPSISVGVTTDTGLVRDENEDAYGTFGTQEEPNQLFIVADGMGGHEYGREASTTTVRVVEETYFNDRSKSVLNRLRFAFRWANGRVHSKAGTRTDGASMGTTATALALAAGRAYLAHVGDSRAYRFHPEESQQLTRDHTVPQRMRRDGILTAEEARSHPRRGTLTRAIGTEPTVEVDLIKAGRLRSGDCFLLCTDGLENLPADVLRDVVLNNDPQPACDELVYRANERGGHDNATALVVRVGPS
jgi:serine/threonine protein phosphatase PrpC